jgi:predicted dehydrogenase
MDLGCYSLHAHRLLADAAGGEPSVVSAKAVERAGHPGIDEKLVAELAFPSGATGVAQCDMAAPSVEMTLRIECTEGEVFVPRFCGSHQDPRVVVRDRNGEREERLTTRSSYAFQLDAFAAAVRDGAALATDADDAVATMTLVDAAYAAAGLPTRSRTTL